MNDLQTKLFEAAREHRAADLALTEATEAAHAAGMRITDAILERAVKAQFQLNEAASAYAEACSVPRDVGFGSFVVPGLEPSIEVGDVFEHLVENRAGLNPLYEKRELCVAWMDYHSVTFAYGRVSRAEANTVNWTWRHVAAMILAGTLRKESLARGPCDYRQIEREACASICSTVSSEAKSADEVRGAERCLRRILARNEMGL